MSLRRNGFEQMIHQKRIDHGCFVYDNNICLQRIFLVFFEATLFGRVFKQSVDGFGLPTCCLTHPFGCPPSRSSKKDSKFQLLKYLYYGGNDGCLASPWATCYNQ